MTQVTTVVKHKIDPPAVAPLSLDLMGTEETPASAPDGKVGEEFKLVITIKGGVAPYKLTEPVVGLAPGLSAVLNGDAVHISGKPTTAGNGIFDIQVTDSAA